MAEMLEFLDWQAKALAATESKDKPKDNRKRFGQNDDQKFDSKKMKFEKNSSNNSNEKRDYNSCRVCKGSHKVIHCDSFKKLNLSQRKKSARENELCFNCLKPFHSANDCKADACKRCDIKHNALLCAKSPMNASAVNSIQKKQSKKEKSEPKKD